jgi:hypothetical protein
MGSPDRIAVEDVGLSDHFLLRHGLSSHLYADDTQVYCSCWSAAVEAFSSISVCVGAIAI